MVEKEEEVAKHRWVMDDSFVELDAHLGSDEGIPLTIIEIRRNPFLVWVVIFFLRRALNTRAFNNRVSK